MAFTFVHAADLHLDSPFRGLASRAPELASVLRDATFRAFDALINLCVDRRAAFLLVAGDVFDSADRSLRAQLRFLDGLRRLDAEGIGAYVVHGNHDPLDGWSSAIEWPANAHFFGSERVETKIVEIEGRALASVSGISFASRRETANLAARFVAELPDLFQIALLHCNCGSVAEHEPYAPCVPGYLAGAGFDYWALGHVHTRRVLAETPAIVYPGNLQGLSIREPGARGCYCVEVERGAMARLEFCALDAARWAQRTIDAASARDVGSLESAIAGAIDSIADEAEGRPCVCRLALEGHTALYGELARSGGIEELLERAREEGLAREPFVWVEKIANRTAPEIDLAERRRAGGLLGELLSISETVRHADDPAKVLAPALAPLHERAAASKALEELSREEALALIEDAERFCASLLEGEA